MAKKRKSELRPIERRAREMAETLLEAGGFKYLSGQIDGLAHALVVFAENEAKQADPELRKESERLASAIKWALGEEGEFGEEPEPLAGKYRRRFWWRTELRQRAFGDMTGRAERSHQSAPDASGAESTAALTKESHQP